MVPHCGSKTINVRLTVSPDAKSKSGDSIKKTIKKQRLKSRRLFKCDNDEEGSGSGGVENNPETTRTTQFTDDTMQPTSIMENRSTPKIGHDKIPTGDAVDGHVAPCCVNDKLQRQSKSNQTRENIYESAPAVPPSNDNNGGITVPKSKSEKIPLNNSSCCQDCRYVNQPYTMDGVLISKPCARRIGRKSRSRKQKTHDAHPAARIRSLSVGNENNYRNFNGDASSGASGKDRNDECLNNLRRNDLIDIIRESMEKSRLCFQSNGYVDHFHTLFFFLYSNVTFGNLKRNPFLKGTNETDKN